MMHKETFISLMVLKDGTDKVGMDRTKTDRAGTDKLQTNKVGMAKDRMDKVGTLKIRGLLIKITHKEAGMTMVSRLHLMGETTPNHKLRKKLMRVNLGDMEWILRVEPPIDPRVILLLESNIPQESQFRYQETLFHRTK